jgi:serine/arginine repetitive matrix protein 2
MYNGIGLSTPRGSGKVLFISILVILALTRWIGTNGYVIRNLSFVKPPPNDRDRNTNDFKSNPQVKKANTAILDHDRKRKVEVKCMELQIKLEDEGYSIIKYAIKIP